MNVKSIAIVAAVLFFVSSWNNPLNAADDSDWFSIPRRAVINADCDYYDRRGNRLGGLQQGQEIVFIGSHYRQREYDVITEIARAVNGEQRGTPIYVAERYITFFDGERYDFWFKNELMTREYYYTGTVEEIYANSGYGRNVREGDARALEQSIRGWRHAYSERRVFFSDNYLVIENEDVYAYRLESVTLESTTEDGNTYTLRLSSSPMSEFELTLIDDGRAIVITNYVKKIGARGIFSIESSLNFKHIPYDSVKSQRTREAVTAWCNEQIRMLSGAR